MPLAMNECWATDFVSDLLYNWKRFRALTVPDLLSRECLAIHVDVAITGERASLVLYGLKEARGLPKRIKVDNAPEFISKAPDAWAYFNKVSCRRCDRSRQVRRTNDHIEQALRWMLLD